METKEQKQGAKLLEYQRKLRDRGIRPGSYQYNRKLGGKNKLCYLPTEYGQKIKDAICKLIKKTMGGNGIHNACKGEEEEVEEEGVEEATRALASLKLNAPDGGGDDDEQGQLDKF